MTKGYCKVLPLPNYNQNILHSFSLLMSKKDNNIMDKHSLWECVIKMFPELISRLQHWGNVCVSLLSILRQVVHLHPRFQCEYESSRALVLC